MSRRQWPAAPLVALGIAAGTASTVPAPAAASPSSRGALAGALDRTLHRAAAKAGDPGVQAVAMHKGKVIWSATSGKAVDRPATPVNASTVFSYASFGKTILATYALRQVERGALALDKPISAYLGTQVPGSDVVTLRMLLTHTAGYPDLYADPATAPLFVKPHYDPNRPFTFAMLAPGIRPPVDPGKHFAYSNTGFIVLARVLSSVAGGDPALERDLRRTFQRQGTGRSAAEGLVTAERSPGAFRRFAHGYTADRDGGLTDVFTSSGATGIPTDLAGLPFGDGMFAGTALGGARFLDALLVRDRLLRPGTVKRMIEPTAQSGVGGDGADERTYGMATYRTRVDGRVWQGHAGTYGGFTSMGATDRARGVTLMVVTNREAPTGSPGVAIWAQLAKAYAAASD